MYLSKFSREAVENRALRWKPISFQRRIYAAVSEYRDEPIDRLLQFALSAKVEIRILKNCGASKKG